MPDRYTFIVNRKETDMYFDCIPSDYFHGDLWHAMTREDHAWIDMMRNGTVALANATFPSVGN